MEHKSCKKQIEKLSGYTKIQTICKCHLECHYPYNQSYSPYLIKKAFQEALHFTKKHWKTVTINTPSPINVIITIGTLQT